MTQSLWLYTGYTVTSLISLVCHPFNSAISIISQHMLIQIYDFQVNYLGAKPHFRKTLKARFLNILKQPKYTQVGFQKQIQRIRHFLINKDITCHNNLKNLQFSHMRNSCHSNCQDFRICLNKYMCIYISIHLNTHRDTNIYYVHISLYDVYIHRA